VKKKELSKFQDFASNSVLGIILSLTVLSVTQFGLEGSFFMAVVIFSNFMISRSISKFLISFFLSISIFAITITILMAITDKTFPTLFSLAVFSIMFLVASLYVASQDWIYQSPNTSETILVLIPVLVILTWYNLLTNVGTSTASDRLTWLVSHGEDNASWLGAINSLSPVHEGGIFHGLTGGGGPALMPIVSVLDGVATISGSSYYSDLSTMTLMNAYGLTLLISLITASVLSISLIKSMHKGKDSILVIASGVVVTLLTYLLNSTIALQGHLSAALAVSAFMGASLICLNVDLNLMTYKRKLFLVGPIVLLIPGFWYPLAPFTLIFIFLLFTDGFREKGLAKSRKVTLIICAAAAAATLPLLRDSFFSTGGINPLNFLAFAGGVIQLSAFAYVILVALILINLKFGLIAAGTQRSMMLLNLMISLGLYLSVTWIATYILPQSGGPMYAVFKLSIVAFAAILPLAIALVIHQLRKEFIDSKIFITAVALIGVVIGAGIPEVANYRSPSRFAEVRWAKSISEIARTNPNSQILCLSALDPLESHLCTRFAVALTASQNELSTNWLSAVRDRIPEDSWQDLLITPFNDRVLTENQGILIVYLDSTQDVETRYPWASKLLTESKVKADQFMNQ
jgi:hypothetical protein